ncbi:hypothetical protein D3C75_1349910 [compost metagenome]
MAKVQRNGGVALGDAGFHQLAYRYRLAAAAIDHAAEIALPEQVGQICTGAFDGKVVAQLLAT